MKKILIIIFSVISINLSSQIVADHNVVDLYDNIPQVYIDSIKKIWVSLPGESHAVGVLQGLVALEGIDGDYAVDTKDYTEGGNPDPYTDANLRFSTAMWGDYGNPTGWIYELGEEDWFTNATAVARVKAGLTYANTNGPALWAMGFGWCWDGTRDNESTGTDPVWGNHWWGRSVNGPEGDRAWGVSDEDNAITGNSINMDTYLEVTQDFIDYCADSIATKIFFTTGPVDYGPTGTFTAEQMYQQHQKYERIRQYIRSHPNTYLLDYADILCYNNDNELQTSTWSGNTFPVIHTDNDAEHSAYAGHVGIVGATRVAKAIWWMLARMIGWDGSNTYYVSTTGSDSYAGDIDHPWATVQKAFDTAEPGDTVYFRGGTWYFAGTNVSPRITPFTATPHGHSGTKELPICYFNYPGEKPIFDFSNTYSTSSIVTGIYLVAAQHIKFKGIEVRNIYQREEAKLGQGITLEYTANLTFENMVINNISGRGVYGEGFTGYYDAATTPEIIYYDTTQFINCDIYNLCDTLSANPGNAADGVKFTIDGRTTAEYPLPYWYFKGCRVWNYSDDAFDLGVNGIIVYDSCWVSSTDKYYVACGNFDGAIEGNGFKQGGVIFPFLAADATLDVTWRTFRNCLAFNCDGSGFHDLGYDGDPDHASLYINNTAYNNDIGFFHSFHSQKQSIYRNNIAYSNAGYEVAIYYPSIYVEDHNTWDATQDSTWPGWVYTDTVTVTDADFLSVDTAGVFGPRQSDGSLPIINFMKLAPSSNLIDAGVDVGLTYSGTAPDIGAFEYSAIDSTRTGILSFSIPEQTGYATIDTVAGTPSVDIGVAYGTDVSSLTPTITLDYGATVSPTSGTAGNFTTPQTYTVTALNGVTEKEYTVTVTVASEPDAPIVATVYTSGANYTAVTANVTGRIYSANGGTLTARGVCWSTTNTSPTISDKHTTYLPYVGSFTDKIWGLRGNTTYYFRAYGTTSEGGTSYGDAISITTPAHATGKISGKVGVVNGKIGIVR